MLLQIAYKHLFKSLFSIPLDIHLEGEFLNLVILCLFLFRNSHTVFHSSCTIYTSTNMLHSHQLCTKFSIFYILTNTCSFFFNIISILMGIKWYLMVLIYSFVTIVPVKHISYIYWPYVYVFWRNVCILIFCLFSTWVIFFVVEL